LKISLHNNPVLNASAWMLGAILSLSAIAISVRELAFHIDTFEMLFFRSLIGLIIVWPFIIIQGRKKIISHHPVAHIIRNITHFAGQYAWYYAIAFIPLAEVFAIEFTTPMWTMLLAALLLAEKITTSRLLALVLGFIGVMVVLRPGIVVIQFASIVMLGGAFCFAITHIYTRKLAQAESPLSILFYMNLIQLPMGLIPTIQLWVSPDALMWFWLTVMGVMAMTAHYCLTRALAVADASLVVPLDFLRLPLIALVGYSFYQESLDWYVLLGATMIFSGNFISVRKEYHMHRTIHKVGHQGE